MIRSLLAQSLLAVVVLAGCGTSPGTPAKGTDEAAMHACVLALKGRVDLPPRDRLGQWPIAKLHVTAQDPGGFLVTGTTKSSPAKRLAAYDFTCHVVADSKVQSGVRVMSLRQAARG